MRDGRACRDLPSFLITSLGQNLLIHEDWQVGSGIKWYRLRKKEKVWNQKDPGYAPRTGLGTSCGVESEIGRIKRTTTLTPVQVQV